jgi:hypothetical protein
LFAGQPFYVFHFLICCLGFYGAWPNALRPARKDVQRKKYGATGRKEQDARPAIQKQSTPAQLPVAEQFSSQQAIIPRAPSSVQQPASLPRSRRNPFRHARYLKATIADPSSPKQPSFLEKISKNVLLLDRELLMDRPEYDWRPDDFEQTFDHKTLMQKLGDPLMRPFPKGFPQRQIFPHLVWLGRSKDIQVSGLNFLHSPVGRSPCSPSKSSVRTSLYL